MYVHISNNDFISGPRHKDCSNSEVLKARRAKYICNHENNVP